jgi:hypothetical protein
MYNWFAIKTAQSSSDATRDNFTLLPKDREEDLKALQAPIRESIKSIRQLLAQNPKNLSDPDHASMADALNNYDLDADKLLQITPNRVFGGYRPSDSEWSEKQQLAKQLQIRYQGLLHSYNSALTKQFNAIQSNAVASDLTMQAIFTAKETIYGKMDKDTVARIAQEEKPIFMEWNGLLSAEARRYFALTDGLQISQNKGHVMAVFDSKKIVAKNLHLLEYPYRVNDLNYFFPVYFAIDGLKNYLTNSSNGRYNNTDKFFGWFGGAYSRATKLEDTLNYCDRIVLNVTGDQLPPRTGSLNQGNLGIQINSFMLSLKDFFEKVKNPDSTKTAVDFSLTPTGTPSGSPSSSPQQQTKTLALSTASSSSSSDPVILSKTSDFPTITSNNPLGFAQVVNPIILGSPAVTQESVDGTVRNNFREKLIKTIKEYNAINSHSIFECSQLVDNLAKLICQSPFYANGAQDLCKLVAYQQSFVVQSYKDTPPRSVNSFMQNIIKYCSEKYTELEKNPNPDKSKLFAALQCVEVLITDREPEKTLATHMSSEMYSGAFKRQGDFKVIVQNFVDERNAEKAKTASDASNLNSKTYEDQLRRQEEARNGQRSSGLFTWTK